MLFDTIAELIADRTGCEKADVKMESTFAELGIDSLDTVELLMSLEDAVGQEIDVSDKVATVGELVRLMEAKGLKVQA